MERLSKRNLLADWSEQLKVRNATLSQEPLVRIKMSLETRDRQSLQTVIIGLTANILLAVIKTTVGIIGNSSALLADGINSTSDVAYYIVATIFMRLARKPADEEHPYGHRQLESIAAVVVGSFVITTAVAIFWDSINKAYNLWMGQADSSPVTIIALWVALATILIKIILTFYTLRVGKQTGNAVVSALAYDHRNDIFSASAAAFGIYLAQQGRLWVDPLAGALVAIVILRTGIHILRESSIELMDAVPSEEIRQQVNVLLADIDGINEVEEVQAHRFGPYLVINLTICIDGNITVSEGDEIADQAEEILHRNIQFLRRVHVHYHPGSPCSAEEHSLSQIFYRSR
jgi:cation diffusion facilitator family transporter